MAQTMLPKDFAREMMELQLENLALRAGTLALRAALECEMTSRGVPAYISLKQQTKPDEDANSEASTHASTTSPVIVSTGQTSPSSLLEPDATAVLPEQLTQALLKARDDAQREAPTRLNSEDQFDACLPCGELASAGAVGHPFTCALPCKFAPRRSGCKDGEQCVRCHLCKWSAQLVKAKSAIAAASCDVAVPDAHASSEPAHVEIAGASNSAPSLGSVGHAESICGNACRYIQRKEGCRDGWNCICCHLCQWSRKVPEKEKTVFETVYLPGAMLLASVHARVTAQ